MPSLSDFQNKFMQGLCSDSDAIFQYLPKADQLSPQQRLAIYQNSITGIKQKSLTEIYPVCHKLVGDEFFIAMISVYIANTPSTSPDIAGYGGNLADFIINFQPAECVPYLSDVARLEWAWHQLFNAAAATQLDFELLANAQVTSGENIIFHLPPSCSLIASSYPVHKIWEVNQEDYVGDNSMILPEHESFYLFVWRNGLQMRMEVLDRETWQVLALIQDGKMLGEIADQWMKENPDSDFIQIMTMVASQGWLVGFEIKT